MAGYVHDRLMRPEGAATAYQVTAGVVSIRETPTPDGRQATQALHGETVHVFREEGEFGLCQLPRDLYTGWVLMEALSAPVIPPTHIVSALRTYCFSEPDMKAAPRFMLCLGARVAATGRVEGLWIECARAGWVHARHLATIDEPLADDPAAVAERYAGTPYLWGGRESLGLDCSGLVQQSFEACGVMMPRDTDMQFAWSGAPVEGWQQPGMLQRGDLIFWDGHVGLMLDASSIIHANAWHMAVAIEPLVPAIDRIRSTYADPIGVRRINVRACRGQVPTWLAAGSGAVQVG